MFVLKYRGHAVADFETHGHAQEVQAGICAAAGLYPYDFTVEQRRHLAGVVIPNPLCAALALLAWDRPVTTIKALRALTGCGLKEAKDFNDEVLRKMNPR